MVWQNEEHMKRTPGCMDLKFLIQTDTVLAGSGRSVLFRRDRRQHSCDLD